MVKKYLLFVGLSLLSSCSSYRPINLGNQYDKNIKELERIAIYKGIEIYPYFTEADSTKIDQSNKQKLIVKIDTIGVEPEIYAAVYSGLTNKGITVGGDSSNAIVKIPKNSCQTIIGRIDTKYFILIGMYFREEIILSTNCIVKMKGKQGHSNIDKEFESSLKQTVNDENELYIGIFPIKWNNKKFQNKQIEDGIIGN